MDAARAARDELFVLYSGGPRSDDPPSSLAWSHRLEELQRMAPQAVGGNTTSTWTTYVDVIKTFQGLDRVRRTNELYISATVDAAVDEFLQTVVTDLQREFSSRSSSDQNARQEREASVRAAQAYDRLVRAIRKSLRMDDVILG